MIEKMKQDLENERPTGIVYRSSLQQIREVFEVDKAKAGELAIAIVEMSIMHDTSTDDAMIKAMLKPQEVMVERNRQEYDAKVEAANNSKIEKLRLPEIAEMVQQGMKQAEIAKVIGVSQQTISNRIKKIEIEYPYLKNTN